MLNLLAATSTLAQDQKKMFFRSGGMGGGMGGMMGPNLLNLASNKDVAAELKLSAEQIENIKLMEQTDREERREEMRKIFENQDEGFEERGKKIADFNQKRSETNEKELTEAIKEDGVKRLKQIRLQIGAKWFGMMMTMNDPEVKKQLEITDEQSKKIAEEGQKMMAEAFAGGGRNPFGGGRGEFKKIEDMDEEEKKKLQDRMAEFEKQQAERIKKGDEFVAGVLTDKQKEIWKTMVGEPIKYEIERPRFGGGGRRGNGTRKNRKDA
jgi:hypothetical protein